MPKKASRPAGSPAIRKSDKSVTPGGLLRRTIYVTEEEWSALLTESFQTGRSASEIVREALKKYLKI